MVEQTSWRLAITLGALGLVRPLLNITGLAEEWGRPATPLLATALVTLVWVGVAVAARTPSPVTTLLVAGLTYALLATALSAVLSATEGELQGPLTNSFAFLAVLLLNAAWGAVSGLLAWAVLRITGRLPRARPRR